MNSKLAALILGAMATLTFASPIASEAAKESINQAATAGSVQELAIEASPEAAQDVTNILVCINANFSGRCERLRNTKGNCCKEKPLSFYPIFQQVMAIGRARWADSMCLDNLYNGFDNEISSVGPDSGTTCELFEYVNISSLACPSR